MTSLEEAVRAMLRSRTNKDIRKHLRKTAELVGYTTVPGEMSKIAAIKDWTEEYGEHFLLRELGVGR